MASLYELTDRYRNLQSVMDNISDSEDAVAMIEAAISSIDDEISVKADGYGRLIKNLEAEADGLRKEEQRLAARRKAKESNAIWLKQHLEQAMIAQNKKKISTDLFTFSLQNNPPAVKIQDKDAFIRWAEMECPTYLSYSAPQVNLKAVAAAIKAGEVVPGATLEQGQSLRMR